MTDKLFTFPFTLSDSMLSIIIVNYKSTEFLKNCVASLLQQDFHFSYEIIVVDNHSQDSVQDTLTQFQSGKIKFIQAGENIGFSRGNNLGFQHSSGELLLFLNPDTEAVDNSFNIAIERLQQDPTIAGCTVGLFYDRECKKRQKNIKNHPDFCSQFFILLKLHHVLAFLPCLKNYLQLDFNYEKEKEIQQMMGACMFIKREAFERVGKFSEDYPLWWDEVDLCFRLALHHFKLLYLPRIKIAHYEGKSFQQEYHGKQKNLLKRIQKRIQKQRRFNNSLFIFFRKYKPRWQYAILRSLNPISILLTILTEIFSIKPKDQGRI